MKTKTNYSLFFGFLLSFLLQLNVGATNYYVSTTGSNSNNGTSTSTAWLSVGYACTQVPANTGHVINLGTGIFNEAGNIIIPSGVSIIGAGKALTTIKVASTKTIFTPAINSSNIVISDLKLDGTNGATASGTCALMCTGMNNFEGKNLSLNNFETGLYFLSSSNINVHDFDATNASACLQPVVGFRNSLINGQVYNATITNTSSQTGTAIHAKSSTYGGHISNLIVHDVTHSTQANGCWETSPGSGIYPPQICIEYWNVNLDNCEIYNCVFNNTLSIQSNGYPYSSLQKTLRIHHCRWDNCLGYQIECVTHNMEIDHNFFGGGAYPLANFGSGDNVNNLKIHHNIFEGNSVRAVFNISGLSDNLQFYNNTINYSGTSNIWLINSCTNSSMMNNIFISAKALGISWKGVMPQTISNNLFYNIPVQGTSYVTTSPQLTGSGTKPNPFYNLSSASPAKDAGVVIAGITNGCIGTPDIGAYEFGATTWTAGLGAYVPVTGVSVSPTITSLTVSGSSQVTATIAPSSATNQIVSWSTNNASIATVSASGLVTGVSAGSATITVTTFDGAKIAACTVTVVPATGNLALNKTATSDTYQTANTVGMGNDGSTTTRWAANDGNTNHWWSVDLGTSASITSTSIMWEANSAYKYKIETSVDNVTWTLAVDKTGNTTIAQTMTNNFTATGRYVKLTVTGFGTSAWASFYEFSVFGNTCTLPTGWSTADVGTVTPAGSACEYTGTYTVQGAGADIWGTTDAFRFVYQTISGDNTIIAKVNSISNSNGWGKTGVMIRETLNANSINAMMAITPSNGSAFQYRTSVGGTSSSVGSTGIIAPYWVKITRGSNAINGYISPDGITWTLVSSQTVTMATSIYMGLAVTSHIDGTLCNSVFSNVSVQTGIKLIQTEFTAIENQSPFSLNVYPNPATDYVTIDFGNQQIEQRAKIALADLVGKIVYKNEVSQISSFKLSTKEFPKGIYILNITTGNEKINKKIILQ